MNARVRMVNATVNANSDKWFLQKR